MPAHSHRTERDTGTQCLLLAPRGRQIPPELLDGLRQRGVAVCEVNDAPAAMVALALRNIATIVIIEPTVWPRLDDLIEAARKYHRGVALWQYETQAQPRLSRYGTPQAQSAMRPMAAAPRPATIDVRPPAQPPARALRDLMAQDELRLTEEELAMLLGDDDVGPAHDSASEERRGR